MRIPFTIQAKTTETRQRVEEYKANIHGQLGISFFSVFFLVSLDVSLSFSVSALARSLSLLISFLCSIFDPKPYFDGTHCAPSTIVANGSLTRNDYYTLFVLQKDHETKPTRERKKRRKMFRTYEIKTAPSQVKSQCAVWLCATHSQRRMANTNAKEIGRHAKNHTLRRFARVYNVRKPKSVTRQPLV